MMATRTYIHRTRYDLVDSYSFNFHIPSIVNIADVRRDSARGVSRVGMHVVEV
jgi:hypothetical protein